MKFRVESWDIWKKMSRDASGRIRRERRNTGLGHV